MSSVLRRNSFVGVFLGVVVLPGLVSASPIIRSGEAVSVEADQLLEGDFYGLGSSVVVSGEAQNDVYIAGGSVTVNAPVHEDLVVAGGTVQVHAPVDDDVRLFGGELTLADEVHGDVVVFGGTVNILSTARVYGDVLFFAGKIELSGPIEGSVIGGGEEIRIDTSIEGDVSVTATRNVTLGDRAEILGNLEYTSREELARAQGAVVVGDIHKKVLEDDTASTDAFGLLLPLLVMLFAALSLYLVLKSPLQRLVDTTMGSYGTQGLIGLGILLGVPFVSIVLMASVLGIIAGLALLILYFLLLIAAWIVAGIVFGSALLMLAKHPSSVTPVSVAVGTAAFYLLSFIPLIGPLVMIAIFVIALGGMSKQIYHLVRS